MSWVRVTFALALTLMLGACAHVAGRDPSSVAFRAMTFNIRLDLASDGANAWPNRKEMVATLVGHEAPDLVGMQEVLLHQKKHLEAALPAYAFVGVARDDGVDKGEFSPLAYRRDRFAVLQSGTFWLSPTPSRPGKGWDAAYPRIATWALLRDTTSGVRLAVLNTHFDHLGQEARVNSAAMIADWARARVAVGLPVVVLGDFNAPPSSAPMLRLTDFRASHLRLARAISTAPPYGPAGTFNAFKIDANEAQPIDHVLVSDDFAVRRFATVTQQWGGRLPSDHYPVVADLALKRYAAVSAGPWPASRQ